MCVEGSIVVVGSFFFLTTAGRQKNVILLQPGDRDGYVPATAIMEEESKFEVELQHFCQGSKGKMMARRLNMIEASNSATKA